jgi:CDP-diacylglycerol--glycerol-3-phosphate 3-phosphatidyltransferase
MSRLALPTLRAAPNATPGPSSVPARYFHGCWLVAPRTTPRVQPSSTRYRNVRSNYTASGQALAPIGVPHKGVAFEELSNGLSASQPCFGARGDEISLLSSPQEFYGTLLEMIGRAKRRIIISSLYIGAEESELVRPEPCLVNPN